MLRKFFSPPVAVFLFLFGLTYGRASLFGVMASSAAPVPALSSLPPLEAQGTSGIQELSRAELVTLMSKFRPLTAAENADLDRGCPGLACVYQALGITRWPESAAGTVAYLAREEALERRCADGGKNFIFLKQAWWTGGKPPKPDMVTRQVPLASVTRIRPGGYTFNYAVYFPSTQTYAWMNHRERGWPLNLIQPQKAYLSHSPPPLQETRNAQIYCSTCRRAD